MNNPGLPEPLWEILDGRIWHATGPEGLKGILTGAAIRIMGARYQGSFCRFLECVALFDFGTTAVDNWNQFNNWSGWFGHQQDSRIAAWLEIDRRAAAAKVKDAREMHRIWQDHKCKTFIPGVEAGHEGPVSVGSIGKVLLIDRHDLSTFAIHDGIDEGLLPKLAEFVRSLPPLIRVLGRSDRGLSEASPVGADQWPSRYGIGDDWQRCRLLPFLHILEPSLQYLKFLQQFGVSCFARIDCFG